MPDGGDDEGLPPALAFLQDQEAFLQRFVLSQVISPPPSRKALMGRPPAPRSPRVTRPTTKKK